MAKHKVLKNPSELKKYFKVNDHPKKGKQLQIAAAKVEVIIPKSYFDIHISEIIGSKIETFGFFDFKVWTQDDWEKYEPDNYSFAFPSRIITCPSKISEFTKDKEKHFRLEYFEHDLFIESITVEKNSQVASNFVDVLFKGKIPDVIPYNELVKYWAECNAINGVNLRVKSVVLQLILSVLSRNPGNIHEEFRKAIASNPDIDMHDNYMVSIEKIPQLTSHFAGISSTDAKHAITAAIGSSRSGEGENQRSPVEEAIQ